MTQKFQDGDIVAFTFNDDGVTPSSLSWKNENDKGCGVILFKDSFNSNYAVKITNPPDYDKGRDFEGVLTGADAKKGKWFDEPALRLVQSAQPSPTIQEFQVGDEIEFTLNDNDFPVRLGWDKKGKIGRGIVTKLLTPQGCEIKIIDPPKIRFSNGSLAGQEEWHFLEHALRHLKSKSSHAPTLTKPTPPVVDERARELEFFAGKKENLGTCNKCGTGLKQLARTKYCPKCG